jgi:hypothetical protein
LENVDVASRLAEPGDAPRQEAQFPIAARAALWVFRRGEPSHHRPNRPLTRIGQIQFPESSVYCKSRGMSVRSMTVGPPLFSKGTSGFGKGPVPQPTVLSQVPSSVLSAARGCPKWLRTFLGFSAASIFYFLSSPVVQSEPLHAGVIPTIKQQLPLCSPDVGVKHATMQDERGLRPNDVLCLRWRKRQLNGKCRHRVHGKLISSADNSVCRELKKRTLNHCAPEADRKHRPAGANDSWRFSIIPHRKLDRKLYIEASTLRGGLQDAMRAIPSYENRVNERPFNGWDVFSGDLGGFRRTVGYDPKANRGYGQHDSEQGDDLLFSAFQENVSPEEQGTNKRTQGSAEGGAVFWVGVLVAGGIVIWLARRKP